MVGMDGGDDMDKGGGYGIFFEIRIGTKRGADRGGGYGIFFEMGVSAKRG